ncbi:MAG: PAS domain S-box protein [Geothrix sp.]|uniref:PAS domain S-box protein n=1 Tax=Geothrix sp. TaxID=1962974 RepID=UPI001840232F|nr:PAS domain S-box protein [Geothrix sp.]NWJ42389.1 PAS domain S-box protein [Geothrix sp.]WIL19645.1 MAG: PAS domain S-box protein [Geothrix sp.]
MTPDPLPKNAARRLRMALSLGAALMAITSLVGTCLRTPLLAAMGPGLVPMSPLGAGLVLLLAAAFWGAEWRPDALGIRRIGLAATALAGGAGLAFVISHVSGGTLPFETSLLRLWPNLQLTSVLTDLTLFGAAASFLARRAPSKGGWAARQAAAILALVPLLIGLVVLVTYVSGAPLLYGTGYIPMSLPAAMCALLLGASQLLAAGRDTWPLAAFRLDHHRSRLGFSPRTVAIYLGLGSLILVGGAALLRRQIHATRMRVQAELSTIADLKARQITEWVVERRGDSQVIAESALIQVQLQRYLAGSPAALPERDLNGWMASLQRTFSYRQVALFDAQGRARLAAYADQLIREPAEDPSELRAALQAPGLTMSDLHQHPGHSDIQLGFWIPVRATAGRPAQGALLLQVDPRTYLYPLVESWPTDSPSAETLLVRREGDQVLFLNDLRHRAHTAMTLRQDLTTNPDGPATRAVLGYEGLLEGPDYRGVPVVSVLRRIPGTTWHMVTKVDAAEVYGPLRQKVWLGGLGLMGIVLLVGAGLGVVLRHRDAEMLRNQLDLTRRYETLMREASDIILLMDAEGRILEANAQALGQYGYARAELIGMDILDLRVPEARAEGHERYQRLRESGSVRFETLHQRRDGSTFPVEVSARALELDGQPRVMSFVRDISERRKNEREIQRMTQLYAALSQVNQAIVWSPDREALFAKICEVMVEFGKFDMAWIGLDDHRVGQVQVVASCGDAHGYLDRIRIESGPTAHGAGPVGRAIREVSPCVVNDFMGTPGTEPWRAAALESGFQAVAAFPIRREGLVIGALAVYSRERGFFGAPEEALLVEAAMDISFALDHLALDDQRRGAEIALLESERQLKEAQEAGGIGTYTWYIREDHWTGSPYLDQLFGVGPDHPRTLEGWVAVVAPDFRDQMAAYVAGIIERHEPFDLDYPILRASDGQRRWVHGRGEIHRDAEDQPVAMVGVIQDITERKLAEQALQKISVAVEQSPLSIVITDPKGTIEYVNPTFTQVTGYTAAEAVGQNPRVLKSPSTPPGHYRTLWETLDRGEVWVGEFENLKKGGEPFHERAIIAPVRDESGMLTGYIAIKEDITQLKQDEAERRSLEAQLHQSQKLENLGSLAGGVAHDMNNVLGAILGLASTLREAAQPFTPTARNLDTIMNACMRGRGVVKGLLYFARKDLQEERSIDLNELVREMSQLLSHTTLKRIQLRMELADGIGRLRGDPGALSHALMNLCVNALDAMPGGGSLLIRTQAEEAGGLTLRVEDTGEGMSPEVLAKAMDPFFTTKPQGKGTGLGLGMVYGTMLAHEGTFELRSELGRGTEAILRFPPSRVGLPEPEADAASALSLQSGRSLHILLVDDDELIRESAGPLLEVIGHTVTDASAGARAIQLLESGLAVDLVILDMNMPGLSGAETLPRILNLRPGLPVIMATGYSDDEITPLLEGRPSVTSIRKPYSLKEIQLKILNLDLQPAPETSAG